MCLVSLDCPAKNAVRVGRTWFSGPRPSFPHHNESSTRNSSLLSFPLAEASKGTTKFAKHAKMKDVLVSGGQYSLPSILVKIGHVLTDL